MSSMDPIRYAGNQVDLASRFAFSTTVAASPAAAAETVICQMSAPPGFRAAEAILLDGWAAFTVGTSGTAARLRIRQTNVAGTVIADTGALTGGVVAAALMAQDVAGVDTGTVAVYVLTLTVTAGAAASTVSAVRLSGLGV